MSVLTAGRDEPAVGTESRRADDSFVAAVARPWQVHFGCGDANDQMIASLPEGTTAIGSRGETLASFSEKSSHAFLVPGT